MTESFDQIAERFVRWLNKRIEISGRGDEIRTLEVEPRGIFWLGKLASEEAVVDLGLGERGERLDPCAIGIRLLPEHAAPWKFEVSVAATAWIRHQQQWKKTNSVDVTLPLEVPAEDFFAGGFGEEILTAAFDAAVGESALRAEVRVEVAPTVHGDQEISIQLVNTSPKEHPSLRDTNLYEVTLGVSGLATKPFTLESLPDSFRYDRSVPAYGINCAVERINNNGFRTADTVIAERARPAYWNVEDVVPDLRFEGLANDPIPPLEKLLTCLTNWGQDAWGEVRLRKRSHSESWSDAMLREAFDAAENFREELARVQDGLSLLTENAHLRKAFCLMNEAIAHGARGKYASWRPFQVGFLLSNLRSVSHPSDESSIADVVWFPTGSGKTETYLGLIVLAAFHDRLTGKMSGVTAWSRFPLRMLSLQQVQRFAEAMAGAELIRKREGIKGDPFSLGFFVGQGATPNRIGLDPQSGDPDPDDPSMPDQFKVLRRCPFCGSSELVMAFDRRNWRLEHKCRNNECAADGAALPFYIVDDEIYRFLPTVVVGTLDKVASIALQAAMRGFIGAPVGICSLAGHGYVYSPRFDRPNGCLVPGCRGERRPITLEPARYGPSFRLQDELHLLKDSLGAVDAHYESLLDHLQRELGGQPPKILASSATLAGYEKQVDVLYKRKARVFPAQGPSAGEGFWNADTGALMRLYVGLAPRGVTLEFATDRLLTELQTNVRRLESDPQKTCSEIGVDPKWAPELASTYGVDVVYGNTLRDLDAVTRSLEAQQVNVSPLGFASLTGRTPFDEVSETLDRLEAPEQEFNDRLHVIAASSMMSHGVDIDRLNIMLMLGIPLTTAEFIQSTARVGRRWPALVFVMHKIARERDASIFRSFKEFITHGDRFIEAVPVTRRSRRVIERTIAGIQLARILAVHEGHSGRVLTTVRRLREYFSEAGITSDDEFQAIRGALELTDPLDQPVVEELEEWLKRFFSNLEDPGGTFRFPSDLCPYGGPMRSLRDVEEQAPVRN